MWVEPSYPHNMRRHLDYISKKIVLNQDHIKAGGKLEMLNSKGQYRVDPPPPQKTCSSWVTDSVQTAETSPKTFLECQNFMFYPVQLM